ncbi:hypothetical protein J1TS3_08100 [Siminovitchia fordii]|uniref:Uncharacterized protein n=1 Tax=Siminovitchia fordii TaxID=254759 RepID=A0ABQ4K205_9BACI|nr:hypothetical protein J1TS3_08100 [Siminovitchia fordii]
MCLAFACQLSINLFEENKFKQPILFNLHGLFNFFHAAMFLQISAHFKQASAHF